MTDEPNNLRQAMASAESHAATQASPPASSEVDRLIATGDRMLRVQQARLADGWTAHEKMKTERQTWYRAEMRRLVDEAEHELLMLDKAWDAARKPIETVIAKLKAMRAA
jgi:hypothetical protein